MHNKTVRILHVDDEPGFADMVSEFLDREDDSLTIETATSPNSALDQFLISDFDCIISDYDMPDQNGIDFLEKTRQKAPDLPFILFTGRGSEQVASEAISAGVTDYIQKESGSDQYTVLANRVRNAVERYRADQARERLESAIETAQEGISILNEDGEFIYVNQTYANLYGYAPEQMIGEHWKLTYLDEEVEFIRTEVLSTIVDGGSWSGETTGVRADGTTFVEDHHLTQTDSGELICSVRNISGEQERQTEITRFRTLVKTLEDPVYVLDETGEFEYVNDAFVEMVGYDRETILESKPALVKSEDTVERAEAVLGQLLSSDGPDSERFEIEIQPSDGESIPCEDHIGVLPYSGDYFEGSVGILRDITEIKEHEKELEQRNQRLNEFASVVSHDLRNPLNVAKGRLQLVEEECDCEHIDPITTALDRMERIIEDVLWLAREGQAIGSTDAVRLQDTVDSAWAMVADQATDAELCHCNDTLSTAVVVADDDRLCQLFENLFRNSMEHSGRKPTVTVGLMDGGFYIEDNGPGIPENRHESVFAAGHSTKEEGTGFGLSIVRQIVKAHDWEIQMTDGSEGGARFEITGVEFMTE